MNIKAIYNEFKSGRKKGKVVLVENGDKKDIIFHGTTLPFAISKWYLDGNLACLESESGDGRLDNVRALNVWNTFDDFLSLLGMDTCYCEDESCKISLVLATDIVDLINVDKFVGERVEDILGEFEGLYIENIKELPEDEYLAMYREKELELVNEYIGFFDIFKICSVKYQKIVEEFKNLVN